MPVSNFEKALFSRPKLPSDFNPDGVHPSGEFQGLPYGPHGFDASSQERSSIIPNLVLLGLALRGHFVASPIESSFTPINPEAMGQPSPNPIVNPSSQDQNERYSNLIDYKNWGEVPGINSQKPRSQVDAPISDLFPKPPEGQEPPEGQIPDDGRDHTPVYLPVPNIPNIKSTEPTTDTIKNEGVLGLQIPGNQEEAPKPQEGGIGGLPAELLKEIEQKLGPGYATDFLIIRPEKENQPALIASVFSSPEDPNKKAIELNGHLYADFSSIQGFFYPNLEIGTPVLWNNPDMSENLGSLTSETPVVLKKPLENGWWQVEAMINGNWIKGCMYTAEIPGKGPAGEIFIVDQLPELKKLINSTNPNNTTVDNNNEAKKTELRLSTKTPDQWIPKKIEGTKYFVELPSAQYDISTDELVELLSYKFTTKDNHLTNGLSIEEINLILEAVKTFDANISDVNPELSRQIRVVIARAPEDIKTKRGNSATSNPLGGPRTILISRDILNKNTEYWWFEIVAHLFEESLHLCQEMSWGQGSHHQDDYQPRQLVLEIAENLKLPQNIIDWCKGIIPQ